MGLDMYLYKTSKTVCPHCGKEIKNSTTTEQVAYWRKANAIHKWFEDHCADGNIENCADYYVSKEQLEELLNTCKRINAASKLVQGKVSDGYRFEDGKKVPMYRIGSVIEDPSVAQELLPTQDGFFFGDTSYDEWYLENVRNTIEQIAGILETTDFDHEDIEYHAWW